MTDLIGIALGCAALLIGLVLFVRGAADLIRRTKDMEKIAGRGR